MNEPNHALFHLEYEKDEVYNVNHPYFVEYQR